MVHHQGNRIVPVNIPTRVDAMIMDQEDTGMAVFCATVVTPFRLAS